MAGVRLLTEEEKELMLLYGKPVTLYALLQAFKRNKPSLLPRCLSYKIQARKNKMINPGGMAIYNYMNCNNIILKSQVVRKTTCPFCQMKCGSLNGVKQHLTSSHALFHFNFRLSENGHPNFDVSVKPDAFENGVLNYDYEKHHLVNFSIHRLESRKRGQVYGPKGRKFCKIFEKYSDDVPRDSANELPHDENGNISSSLARTRLSENTRDIQTITQPAIGQCSKAKGPRDEANELPHENGNISSSPARTRLSEKTSDIQTITQLAIVLWSKAKGPRSRRRKKLYPQRVQVERPEPLKSRQFYHSRTLQPMTLEEVLADEDSDDDADEDFNDLIERLMLDRLKDASEEEKRFMWLWNTFMRKKRVFVDKQVPWACEEFIKAHAKELITSNLIWQWRMFAIDVLCFKYRLISAKTMDKCSIILQNVQEGKEPIDEAEEAAAAAEVAEAAKAKAEAKAAARAAKVAAAAAAAVASASKVTRKSARIDKKKQQEAAAATSKANANGKEPQSMEHDEERTLAMVSVKDLHF